jgi:Aerotolerance regulator N-terminal
MGLIFAGILPGLAAILAPVLIHLIRTQRSERVDLGTLRFLRKAMQKRRRWRRIENWPLLLARAAIVALLTLIFARPFLVMRDRIKSGDLEAIVLVDESGSLSGPAFDAVRRAARETLAKIPDGAKLTIAGFADDVHLLSGGLDGLRAAPGARTDYVRAINWTLDRIAQSDRKYAHVYLISDLQRSALPPEPPRVWPSNAQATVVRVAPAGTWNAAIAKVELLTPYAADEAEMEVTCVVSGEAPKVEREVRFAIDGQPVQTQKAGPDGGRFLFRWKPDGETLIRGTAAVASNDAFPEDNSRPFATRLAPPKRVVLVEGGAPLTPFEGAAYFAAKALTVSGKDRGASAFAPRVQAAQKDFSEAAAVAFCDVDGPHPEIVSELAKFIDQGGGAAFFLGSHTNLERFAALAATGLFPKRITATLAPLPRPIASWDRTHQALARFDGAERGDLRGVALRDAFEIDPEPEWNVLARLENGHPVLLAREMGKGRVLVFANPLTRDWNELPRERIFVPLVREWFTWLTHLDPQKDAPKEIPAGLSEPRPTGVYEADGRIEIIAPDPAEMDVATASEPAARRALGLPDESSVPFAVPENPALPLLRQRPHELWPWIALALLAAMVLENRLADRKIKRQAHAA